VLRRRSADQRRGTSPPTPRALTDINQVKNGVFSTLSLTRNEPAYFIFVALAPICLALRIALHAFPSLSRSARERCSR
jgi:hypothetical protein